MRKTDPQKANLNLKRDCLLAFGAGVVQSVCFAPRPLGSVAILCLACLFYLWLKHRTRGRLLTGLAFGLGLFGTGVSWVYVSLHEFGYMPVPLAAAGTFGFVLLLSLFPMLAGWLQGLLRIGPGLRLVIAMPVFWVTAEWCREWVMTGFPWMTLGYAQANNPLAGYAPLAGVLAISLASATIAGLTVYLVRVVKTPRPLAITLVLGLVGGGYTAVSHPWAQVRDTPISVALVQGNINLADKWAPGNAGNVINTYLSLTESATEPDLMVWPESAVPLELDLLSQGFWSRLTNLGPAVLIGVVERGTSGGDYYNSAVGIGGGNPQFYRKTHLVPFGEYMPLRPLFGWVLDWLSIPMADFSVYSEAQSPISLAGTGIGVTICYEDAFPLDTRRVVPDEGLLINLSEDAWFGNSLAPHQRLQMARIRALENARPVLRAANTGITALIDHEGEVVASIGQFRAGVLEVEAYPTSGRTPFNRYGHWPLLLWLMLSAAWLLLLNLRNRKMEQLH